MSGIQVDRSTAGAIASANLVRAQLNTVSTPEQRRVTLHQDSSYESAQTLTHSDGSRTDLPGFDSQNSASVNAMYEQATPEQAAKFHEASHNLGNVMAEQADAVAAAATNGEPLSEHVTVAFNESAEVLIEFAKEGDQAEILEGVLQGAVAEAEKDMASFAQNIKAKTDQKADLRSSVKMLDEMVSEWPDDGSTQIFDWSFPSFDEDGNMTVKNFSEPLTKEEAISLRGDMDNTIKQMNDMSPLEQQMMQNLIQRYQQMLTALSNIMKAYHSTAMSIINNLK